MHLTEQDFEIRDTDIPERYQLLPFKPEPISAEVAREEAEWIFLHVLNANDRFTRL